MQKHVVQVGPQFPGLAQGVVIALPGCRLLETSAIIGDASGGTMVTDNFDEQAKQALSNLKAVLDAAQFQTTDVIHLGVDLLGTFEGKWQPLKSLLIEFFGEHVVCRTPRACSELPLGAQLSLTVRAVA